MDEIYFKIADKFEPKDMRTFARIINLAEKEGLSPFELRDYVNRFMVQKFLLQTDFKPCPHCDAPMALSPVNTNPKNQVEGNFKSQWWCVRCDESDFNENTVDEEIKMRSL